MSDDTISSLPLVRIIRGLCLAGHFFLAPVILIPTVLLLCTAETLEARLVAVMAIAFYLASLLAWLLFYENIRRAILIILSLFCVIGMVALGAAILRRPTGPPSGGNFSQHYLGEAKFKSTSIANLVPEIDQLKFGSLVIGSVDGPLAASGTGRIRDLVLKIYREADADPAFREAGSALGFCYADILLGERKRLHFNQYVPRQLNRERYPVLIFLHGALGNFKGYTWVLKRFSDQTGIAVIAPTFGVGDWRRDPKGKVMKEVLAYVASQKEFDSNQLYLAGLSNGGMGVTRSVLRGDTKWKGVIYLSPVIEPRVIAAPLFVERSQKVPILIIHGETDDRIPFHFVQANAAQLKANGAIVTERYYPGEDHFLVFSQPDAVVADMIKWLETK